MRLFYISLMFSFSCYAELTKAPKFNLLNSPSSGSINNLKGTGVSDFTPHGTQPGLTFQVTPANNCNDCHSSFGFGGTEVDKQFMPTDTWAGSMMANATRDPLFWAAVDIANQDVPGVGDFCIRCHTPTGFYKGHTKNGAGNQDYANGCKLTGTMTTQDNGTNDYQGVNCHFCHRQEEKGPNSEALITNNSNVWLDDENCNNPDSNNNFGPCRKGPYNPPLADVHSWEYSSFISKGEFCGTCHNVSSPEILNNGVLTIAKKLWDNGVETDVAMPIERTFAEWQNSLFSDLIFVDGLDVSNSTLPNIKTGQTCQDCHMPESSDPNTRACGLVAAGSRTNNLKKHEFAGGNSWMPAVIKAEYGAALSNGDFDRSAAFDQTISYALDMLQNKSAVVETSLISASNTEAVVKVKVTNLTGHKLPTGYPEGRRMWINLTVRDNTNAIIYQSGAYDNATAILTNDADIKIYETHQGIWDSNTGDCVIEDNGQKLFHFALNNCVAKDNRIPPLGFRGGTDLEIKPVGINYPLDPNNPAATVNYDDTNYTIAIPNGSVFPLSVTATLKYQSASKDYIDFLNDESTTASENDLCNRTQTVGPASQTRGAFMKELWQNNGKSAPVDMGSSIIQIAQ